MRAIRSRERRLKPAKIGTRASASARSFSVIGSILGSTRAPRSSRGRPSRPLRPRRATFVPLRGGGGRPPPLRTPRRRAPRPSEPSRARSGAGTRHARSTRGAVRPARRAAFRPAPRTSSRVRGRGRRRVRGPPPPARSSRRAWYSRPASPRRRNPKGRRRAASPAPIARASTAPRARRDRRRKSGASPSPPSGSTRRPRDRHRGAGARRGCPWRRVRRPRRRSPRLGYFPLRRGPFGHRDFRLLFLGRTTSFVGNAFANVAEQGCTQVLGPAIAKAHLGGAAAWGLVLTAQSLGLLAGGLLLLRLRPRRLLLAATLGFLLTIPFLLALSVPVALVAVVAAAAIGGIGTEIFGVLWEPPLQQGISQR